jgi:hypothetical protein
MNISATFIRKPIATGMLMAAILLLGVISYELLPVEALPNIDSPTILVTAQFPGADAQTVAGTVTTPLERKGGEESVTCYAERVGTDRQGSRGCGPSPRGARWFSQFDGPSSRTEIA